MMSRWGLSCFGAFALSRNFDESFLFLNALCTISSFSAISLIAQNLARDQFLVLFTYQLVSTNLKMLVGIFTAINWAHWTFIFIFIPHFQQLFFPISFEWTLSRSEVFPVGFLCESSSDWVAWKMERKAFRECFSSFKLVGMLSSGLSSVRWAIVALMHSTLTPARTILYTAPPPCTVSIDRIRCRGSITRDSSDGWLHRSPMDCFRSSDRLKDSPWKALTQTSDRLTDRPSNSHWNRPSYGPRLNQ